MRLIKLALISIIFLFIVSTAVSLLIPSHIRISKATNISGAKDSILALIKDKDRWNEWHPAFMPSASGRNFQAIDINTINQNDSEVVMQLKQGDKEPVISGWKVFEHAAADSLTLQWYMDFKLKWYPWEKFSSMLYERTYGTMMEQGLTNIKERVQGSR